MAQQLTITITVTVALATDYVIWSFMSLRMRQRLLDARAARGMLAATAVRHRVRLAMPGCGSCAAADPQAREQVRRRHRPT
jgi:hypothetical protein